MSAQSAEKDAPRITAVVVHVTCDRCALDDEFEFAPEDIKAGAEISTPCACDRRLAVSADAWAQYTRVTPPEQSAP